MMSPGVVRDSMEHEFPNICKKLHLSSIIHHHVVMLSLLIQLQISIYCGTYANMYLMLHLPYPKSQNAMFVNKKIDYRQGLPQLLFRLFFFKLETGKIYMYDHSFAFSHCLT